MQKKRITPLSIIPGFEEVAAAASKLIRDNKTTYDGNIENAAISGGIEATSYMIGDTISNNEDMIEMFPELVMAAQVLASNILSPKDMLLVNFLYKFNKKLFPQDVEGAIISIIKEELTNHYKLETSAGKILEEIILTKGSNIKAIIPEGSLDAFINSRNSGFTNEGRNTYESVTDFIDKRELSTERPMGFLGKELTDKAFSTIESSGDSIAKKSESLNVSAGPYAFITDNYTFLTRQVTAEVAAATLADDIIFKQANHSSITTAESSKDSIFKRVSRSYSAVSEISSKGDRDSVGRPLVLDLPPESVIVIHRPGSPEDVVAYLVVVTDEGYPITKEFMRSELQVLERNGVKRGTTMSKYLINRAKEDMYGKAGCINFKEAAELYGMAQEKDLVSAFKDTIYGDNISFGASSSGVYSVMLARAVSNANSRLIFMPKEIVSYIALERYSNGIGKSVMDSLQKINGLKATLMLANVTKEVTNSIGMTKVKMNIDPKDPDPFKTVQKGRAIIMSSSAGMLPTSAKNFSDYAAWSREAGIFIEYGGHPKLPDVSFDFQTVTANQPVGDLGFIERLNDQSIMAFGLTPEMVEESRRTDFAVSITSRNSMLAKRVLISQGIIMDAYTDRGRKICRYDEIIATRCKEIIRDSMENIMNSLKEFEQKDYELYNNIKEKDDLVGILYSKALNHLVLELPTPDVGADARMSREFEDYKSSLEESVPICISKESAMMIGQDVNMDLLEKLIIENKLREWMLNRGYMPELFDTLHESTLNKGDLFGEILEYTNKMAANAKLIERKGKEGEGAKNESESESEEPDAVITDEVESEDLSDSTANNDTEAKEAEAKEAEEEDISQKDDEEGATPSSKASPDNIEDGDTNDDRAV